MTRDPISLFEFVDQTEVDRFFPIDDQVMGGVSRSSLTATKNSIASFGGVVSFENNGGFASIRTELESLDLSAASGIRMRVSGDGKRYKLRLLNSSSFDTVVYESSFLSPQESWKEIDLPFSSFHPMWRGRVVENAPAFDSENICALGLMISDKQEGDFLLSIDWIRTFN